MSERVCVCVCKAGIAKLALYRTPFSPCLRGCVREDEMNFAFLGTVSIGRGTASEQARLDLSVVHQHVNHQHVNLANRDGARGHTLTDSLGRQGRAEKSTSLVCGDPGPRALKSISLSLSVSLSLSLAHAPSNQARVSRSSRSGQHHV